MQSEHEAQDHVTIHEKSHRVVQRDKDGLHNSLHMLTQYIIGLHLDGDHIDTGRQ